MEEKPHHAGTANLIPVKPGEVRNPNGRGKGVRGRKTIVREMLERAALDSFKDGQKEIIGDGFEPATVADQLAAAMVAKAMSGDVAAFKELLDSAYGKLTDKIDNTHSLALMGTVKVKPEQNGAAIALEFDVGQKVLPPGQEE